MSYRFIPGAPANLDRIFGLSDTNIWVGASSAALLYRFDGQNFTPTAEVYAGAANFGNFWGPTANKLYVARAGVSFGINVTVDGGVNWVTILKPAGDVYWVFGFEGTTDLYCIVTSAGGYDVYHTVNDGALWTRILDGTTVPGGTLTIAPASNQPLGGSGPTDLWLAADGFYGVYDGVGWTWYSAGNDVATWSSIHTVGVGEIYLGGVAGGVGKIMHVTGGGATRTLQTPQPYAGVFSVFGDGATVFAVEYGDAANFKVQGRNSDADWAYIMTQASTDATYGYTSNGFKAIIVGLAVSEQQGYPVDWAIQGLSPPMLYPPDKNAISPFHPEPLPFRPDPTGIGGTFEPGPAPPSVLPEPTNPTGNGGTAAPPEAPPQVLPEPTATESVDFTPAPTTVQLDGQANRVDPYTTQDQINDFFRIISPRPGSGQ